MPDKRELSQFLKSLLEEDIYKESDFSFVLDEEKRKINNLAKVIKKFAEGEIYLGNAEKILDYTICSDAISADCLPFVDSTGKIPSRYINLQSILSPYSVGEIHLQDESVSTRTIRNNAVTEQKIANNSITTQKLANNSVTTDKLADLSVTTQKLANSAVTTEKIANASVTSEKLAPDVFNTNTIPDNVTIKILGDFVFDEVNWNDYKTAGIYRVFGVSSFGGSNQPPATYKYGSLAVLRGQNGGITQIFVPHLLDTNFYVRHNWDGEDIQWSAWRIYPSSNENSSISGIWSFINGLRANLIRNNTGYTFTLISSGSINVNIDNDNTGNGAFIINKGPNGSIELMRLTNTGRLGLGTNNPQSTLDVNGDLKVSDKIVIGGTCLVMGVMQNVF
ncbi:MAG: pyocin knob domain-containing protein [Candidatus Aenigmatarchaeota archaeon]